MNERSQRSSSVQARILSFEKGFNRSERLDMDERARLHRAPLLDGLCRVAVVNQDLSHGDDGHVAGVIRFPDLTFRQGDGHWFCFQGVKLKK